MLFYLATLINLGASSWILHSNPICNRTLSLNWFDLHSQTIYDTMIDTRDTSLVDHYGENKFKTPSWDFIHLYVGSGWKRNHFLYCYQFWILERVYNQLVSFKCWLCQISSKTIKYTMTNTVWFIIWHQHLWLTFVTTSRLERCHSMYAFINKHFYGTLTWILHKFRGYE